MPRVALTRIKVNPEDRQREDIGNIEELANSFQEFGQLQPILLDNELNLIAGFRRLTAAASLGWDSIHAELLGEISDVRSKEIELEENVRRKQLDWHEEQKAIAELHQLKSDEDPTWSIDKTAAMIGKSRRTVYNAIELSTAVETVPEVRKAESAHGAMLRLKRHKQIEQRKDDAKARKLAEEIGLRSKVNVEIVCANAIEHLQGLQAESADMVVTNPPYGVSIEDLFIGDKEGLIYSDDEKAVVALLEAAVREVHRVLRPDKWFVFFYPTARLEEGKRLLTKAGFKFQAIPCIWYKPNKFVSALSNPYQHFSSMYETFFWGRKGEPQFSRVRAGNVFVHDTPESVDRIHPLQMPVALWKEIIEIGTVTGEYVIEPFAGSGSAGAACIETERNYLGIELSQEFADRGNAWFSELIEGRAKVAQAGPSDAELIQDLEFME